RNRAGHFARMHGDCRRNDIPTLDARIEQPLQTVLRAWLRQAGAA
ncbi:MAG: hypothetical protein JWP34_3811, partial [Massilia sp.]|nr:hypothetical protein [Massilia sp.]